MSFIASNNELISYEDFIDKAEDIGAFLQSTGFIAKDKILIAKRTGIEQICCFIGAMLSGFIPIIIPHPSSKVKNEFFEQKMYKINNAVNPALCICDEEDLHIYEKYFKTISKIENVNKPLGKANISNEDTAFIQLSSGTTDIPKIIEISHKAVIAQCEEYASALKLSKDDVIISWLPLYHDMGLIACLMMPILKGISFVHINPFEWLTSPESLFENIEKYNGTHVWMPNFAFPFLAKKMQNKSFNLTSVKNWVSCSEITHYKYITEFSETFNIPQNKISNCYALAENVFAVSQSNGIKINGNHVSCGELLPGTSVLIHDSKVLIKSSYMASNIVKSNGYYDTGDIGYFKDNELYIVGRADDMIIHYGKNIFPYEIENIVSNTDGILPGRVACVGVENVLGTQDIHVIAETDTITDELQYEIIKNILQAFDITCICHLVAPGSIIKTSSGKINRKETKTKCLMM